MTWISLSYATFGLVHYDGIVIEAPPIAKWCVGRKVDYVKQYYQRKGAKIHEF